MGKDADPSRSEVAAKNNCWCNDLFNVARAREPAFTALPGDCPCERPLPAQVLEEPLIASVSDGDWESGERLVKEEVLQSRS